MDNPSIVATPKPWIEVGTLTSAFAEAPFPASKEAKQLAIALYQEIDKAYVRHFGGLKGLGIFLLYMCSVLLDIIPPNRELVADTLGRRYIWIHTR